MKLGNKIHLYTSVLVFIIVVLLVFAIYFSFSRMMIGSEVEQTVEEARQTASTFNESADNFSAEQLLRAYAPTEGMVSIVLQDDSRAATVTSPAEGSLTEESVEYYSEEYVQVAQYHGERYAFVSVPVIWTNGQVANIQITDSLRPTEETLAVLRVILIIATIAAVIPVFLSARLLRRVILRPIAALSATMQDIQTSGRFKRIPTSSKSKDEIEQLGDTFNEMIERLEDNYHKQEQFVSNASHELKTPLTVIESYASLLQRRGASRPEIIEESVEAIHSEAIRMRELTQQLLLLARHSEKANMHMTEVDLKVVTADAVQNYRSSYHREINFSGKTAIVQTDADKVKQLLYILLDNARKYSSDVIDVKIETEGTPVIAVIDRGIGIPEKDTERVFERFYRVDESRTRSSGGYGLGLSLAKDITEALGAGITIESTYGQGTEVRLIFPENAG